MDDLTSAMNDSQKVAKLHDIINFLNTGLQECESARRAANDTWALNEIIKDRKKFSSAIMPVNAGEQIARKYDMLPKGKVGQYISFLGSQSRGGLDYEHQVARDNMIMLIVAAGILYSEYEYLRNLEKNTNFSGVEKVALDMMGEDVDWAHEKIVPALDMLSNDSSEDVRKQIQNALYYKFGDYYYRHCDDEGDDYLRDVSVLEDWCKNLEKYKEDIKIEKYHMISSVEKKLGGGPCPLYKLYYDLSQSLGTVMRGDYITYKRGNPYHVEDMLEIVMTVKKRMGTQYVIGPSTNLWTNEVLKTIDSDIMYWNDRLNQANVNFASVEAQTAKYYDMLNPSENLLKLIKESKKNSK